MNMRELTPEDLTVVYEAMAEQAIGIVNAGKEASPQLFFFQVDDDRPGFFLHVRAVDPKLISVLHAQPNTLRVMRHTIAATLGSETTTSPFPLRQSLIDEGVRPDIAVHISEVWIAKAVPKDDPLRGLPAGERLDRMSALAVYVHVKGHTYGEVMPIETVDGKRHVELRALRLDGSAQLGGDFTMQGWDDVPEEHRP
jgi:hypothetical protein